MAVKRYAHMDGDAVTNVSVWDGVSLWQPGCEVLELPSDSPVGPGWTRGVNGEWVAPPPSAEALEIMATAGNSEAFV